MSPSERPDTSVEDDTADHRYVITVDGDQAGFAAYREIDAGTRVFTHTSVGPLYEGKGIGSALAKAALDDARQRALRVVPQCPFIAAYIQRHHEYDDLVTEQ